MAQILFLEVREEVLGRRIIPTIAAAGHRGSDVPLFDQNLMVSLGGVLEALVAVQDQPVCELLVVFGLLDVLHDQCHIITSV